MYLVDFQNLVKENALSNEKTNHEDWVMQKLKISNVLSHRSNQRIMNSNIPLNIFYH